MKINDFQQKNTKILQKLQETVFHIPLTTYRRWEYPIENYDENPIRTTHVVQIMAYAIR